MKLKQGFLLREIAGDTVVIPTGEMVDLNMMITLNDTGKFIWQQLESETDEAAIVQALLAEYDVDEATAQVSVASFVRSLQEHGFIQ